MTNIKNWLLTALLAIAGVLDVGFGVITDLGAQLHIDPKVVTFVRVAIMVVGGIILKLQLPSTNPDKLQVLVNKVRDKKEAA